MRRATRIVVGLEVGTSKVCAVVGECTGPDSVKVLGVGQMPSRGVRKAQVVSADDVVDDIRRALCRAEESADVEIRSVCLGVSGAHVRGVSNHAVHRLGETRRRVTAEDVRTVLQSARTVNLPPGNMILGVERRPFRLDGQDGIENPVGMVGVTLEADVYVIQGNENSVLQFVNAIRSLSLEVEHVTFTGLCAAMAALTPELREAGVLLMDIGAGVTEYVVYYRDALLVCGVLGVGGDHVTNDLACGLNLSFAAAENLKLKYGSAVYDACSRHEDAAVSEGTTLGRRTVKQGVVHLVMQCRLEEIIRVVLREVNEVIPIEYLRGGIVLCGGVARTNRILELVETVSGLPVRVGEPLALTGLSSELRQPELVAPVGVMLQAARRAAALHRGGPGFLAPVQRMVGRWVDVVRGVSANLF